ncbi:MAG: hypothetical protein LBK43_03630 [Treponema sp.]|jgi:uncharacterized coiled-coil protein SlyX|nr:hypothetical protein [Treponema sp.]
MIKRIKLRIDTAANFALMNPTLRNGETAIEIQEDGNRKMKTGNGYTQWLDLPYLVDDEKYDGILQQIGEQEEEQDGRLENLEQTVAFQIQTLTELQEETEEQRIALDTLTKSFNCHLKLLKKTNTKNQEQDRILRNLSTRVETLEDPRLTDEIVEGLQEKDQEQEDRLDKLDADNQQRDADITAIKTKNTTQDTAIAQLGTSVSTFGEQLTAVETAQGGFTNTFLELQEKAKAQEARVETLEQSAASNPADLGAVQTQITNLAETFQTETAQLKTKDQAHDTAINALAKILTQEKIDRIDHDKALADALDESVMELQQAQEQETQERTEAVTNLEQVQEQENKDRTEADSAIEQAILEINETIEAQGAAQEQETEDRTEADEALQEQITAIHESLQEHVGDTDNPHGVTKDQVGLSSVNNTSDQDKPVSTAQVAAITASLNAAKEYIDAQIQAFIRNTLHYMGNVATYTDLPEDPELFDLWHVLDTGNGYYWFGDMWNLLDFSLDLSQYYTAEETDAFLNEKVDKEPGKGLSSNDFTDSSKQMLQALAGDLKVFHDGITHKSDVYEDILLTRNMLRSDLSITNSSMEVGFDGIKFRIVATSTTNLRTEVLAEISGQNVIATIRRNTFYNSATEGQTIQNRILNDTPYIIDSTIYTASNDYSIYQIFVANHWWEINLWPANDKSDVAMSVERRL